MSAPTYWDYLRLPELLSLQTGLDHVEDELLSDELHFIVVHQTYELWFKMVLRSVRLARNHLATPKVSEEIIPHVAHHLRRANAILRLGVHQFEVMETLTPQDFLAFRDKLTPSSGFQSYQLRELEILMGLEESQRIRYGKVDPLEHIRRLAIDSPGGQLAWNRILQARGEETLLSVLEDWLFRTPIQGSSPEDPGDDEVVDTFIRQYLEASSENLDRNLERLVGTLSDSEDPAALRERFDGIREAAEAFLHGDDVPESLRDRTRRVRAAALFIESYRALPLLAWPRLLLDVVVEFEEQLILWRHRHVRMVERLIGRRVGTGGSSGVGYLDRTLAYRVFRDLWAIRTVLLPRKLLPRLQKPELYGFAEH